MFLNDSKDHLGKRAVCVHTKFFENRCGGVADILCQIDVDGFDMQQVH